MFHPIFNWTRQFIIFRFENQNEAQFSTIWFWIFEKKKHLKEGTADFDGHVGIPECYWLTTRLEIKLTLIQTFRFRLWSLTNILLSSVSIN